MKIIYFHQHFTTPSVGGGIRSYQFARQLIKEGHQVTVVSGGTCFLGLPSTTVKNVYRGYLDGIDVVQIMISYSNSFSLFQRMKSFLTYARRGIQFAMKEEYDLLFATSTPLTAGIPGIFAKIFRRKPFVFEVRDLWPELPKALGLKNPFFLLGMSALEKMSYWIADACVGLSPGICGGIKRRSQKDKMIEMIPNGCDLDIFVPGERENLNLEGISREDKVAIFTGAHGIANGLDAVLDMASVLKKRNRTDIKIVFVGDGKLKPALKDRAQREKLDNCLFFDPVSKNELKDIVSSADMGLMVLKNVPAFYYGTSPNKFFDYISAGLSIVNNYPGWLCDLITENQCGVVVSPDDAEAFADGVVYLADHPEERKQFGMNSRVLAEREYSRDRLAGQFVSFLEEVYSRTIK